LREELKLVVSVFHEQIVGRHNKLCEKRHPQRNCNKKNHQKREQVKVLTSHYTLFQKVIHRFLRKLEKIYVLCPWNMLNKKA